MTLQVLHKSLCGKTAPKYPLMICLYIFNPDFWGFLIYTVLTLIYFSLSLISLYFHFKEADLLVFLIQSQGIVFQSSLQKNNVENLTRLCRQDGLSSESLDLNITTAAWNHLDKRTKLNATDVQSLTLESPSTCLKKDR